MRTEGCRGDQSGLGAQRWEDWQTVGLGTGHAPQGSFLGDFCHSPGCSPFWGAPFVPKSPLWEIPLRSVVQCATGQPHAWVPVSAGARPGQGAWKIVLGPGELGAQGRVVLSFLSPLCPVTLRAQARSVPLATCARGTHRCPLPCRVPPSLLEGPSEPGPLTRAIPIGLVSFHLNLARFYCHLSGLTSLGGRLPRLVPIMQSSACWINFLFRIDSSFLHK